MAGLLNVGEMSALALHALVELAGSRAADPDARLRVRDMAERLHASQHTLHKVVRRLVDAGLLDSTRGPAGGVKLAEEPDNIMILRVVEAVDGRINANGCLFGRRLCAPGIRCAFGGLTRHLEESIHDYFATTSLKQLITNNDDVGILKSAKPGVQAF